MANSAINLSYSGNGPTDSGQVIADQTSGSRSRTLVASGSSTTDNSSATIQVNYIDGTKTLTFTPSAVLVTLKSANVAAQAFKVDAVDNAKFNLVGAGNWAAGTLSIAVQIVP